MAEIMELAELEDINFDFFYLEVNKPIRDKT